MPHEAHLPHILLEPIDTNREVGDVLRTVVAEWTRFWLPRGRVAVEWSGGRVELAVTGGLNRWKP